MTVQDARLRISEFKSLLARDIDPSDQHEQKTNDWTFRKFSKELYLPHAIQLKKTWEDDQYKLDRQIIPAFGDYRVSSITSRDISTFLTQQKERTSSTTANHYATLIKRMFNLAVKWGLLEKSPATSLDRFKEKSHRECCLNKEELPRFLKALDELVDGLSKTAIKPPLFTGGRRGEITPIRYDQLKLNEKRLFLPDTKNGQSRSIILNDRAMAVRRELKRNKDNSTRTKESDCLFPTKKGTKNPHIYDLRTLFRKACDVAGISALRVHDLRHSFATLALQVGASLYDVSRLMGTFRRQHDSEICPCGR